jgi:hypothetical protein
MNRLMAMLPVCIALIFGLPMVHAAAGASGTGGGADAAASTDTGRTFTLIRVAPITGTNPFGFQSLRDDITGGSAPSVGRCKPGPLLLTSALPLVTGGNVFVDVDPSAGTLRIRDGGGSTANSALVISLPAMDTTRFAIGSSGWTAVSPALPRTFSAGAPPQSFVVRQTASGDAYRLTIGFLGTSSLRISTASGQCCGTGSCP